MVPRALTVVVPAAGLAAVGWWSGGYFPRSFGALLLAAAVGIAAVAIIADQVELGGRTVALAGALFALAAWQTVTTAWAVAPDAPVLEAERTLVYASGALLALLAVPSRRAGYLVFAVLVGAGTATVTGLLAHALGAGTPDERLELPVGYANAAGIVAATALVLGLGLSTGRGRVGRALAGGMVAPSAATIAPRDTESQSVAAVLGVLVLGVVTACRRSLATVAIVATPGLVAIGVVSLAGRLRDSGAAPREVLTLVVIGGLAVAGGRLAVGRDWQDRRRQEVDVRRRLPIVGLCALVVVGVAAAVTLEFGRSHPAPSIEDGDAPDRLLSTSTSLRGDYWRVAVRMVEHHPLGGDGAGGFTRVWLQERPALLFVRDAHNLYLETLAELGPLGLALLLVALGTPLLGARHAASDAEGSAALAAYAGLLAHAALDWDWELPAVTLCTLLLAVALVRLGTREPVRTLTFSGRAVGLGAATLLGAAAIVIHTGNGATADANDLLDRGDAAAARAVAARAKLFRPWAAEPWELMGEAELGLGRAEEARADLRRALRRDPRSWGAWLSLAAASTGSERDHAIARARALNPLAPEVDLINP